VLTDADPEMFDAAVGAWLMNMARFAAPVAGRADDRVPGRGALRLAGRPDITEATRWAGRSMDRPFIILGLTS
jgi:hypothetical protein